MNEQTQAAAIDSKAHCVIYGGNGYVGTAIAKYLIQLGAKVTCISRSGEMPAHLYFQGEDWSKQVVWQKGDALEPDTALLASATAVVALIGSAPVPTISVSARRQQEFNNGQPNAKLIRTAALCKVKRLVLLAAEIPEFMRSKKFGYYLGKNISIAAATDYVDMSEANSAAILYPSGIYGTRYLKSGTGIPLYWFMQPVAAVQKLMPKVLAKYLPATLVSIDQVGLCAAKACLDDFSGLKDITNEEIADTEV